MNYKNINLKLLGLTLFTGIGFYNLKTASANLPSISNNSVFHFTRIVDKAEESHKKLLAIEANKDISNSELFIHWQEGRKYLAAKAAKYESNLPLASGKDEEEYAFSLSSTEGSNDSAESSRTKAIRTISLYLFLLLFVPFGVFYPFFIFYKKLLNDNFDDDDNETDVYIELDHSSEPKPLTSLSLESLNEKELVDDIQAVVSQLQIAFAVNDDSLKEKLVELCSNVDSRTDSGIAELMRKTISLLINQKEYTHVNCSSNSFPVNRIKTEFEAICVREQSKSVSEKLSIIDGEEKVTKPKANPNGNSSVTYVVVTLALCTSHSKPLFGEIRTKNQLLAKLSELGKIRQEELIKFDLLWNPQSKNRYLSNNELLKNYIDMIRLF